MEKLTAIRLQAHIDECKYRIGKINEFVLSNRDVNTVMCAKNVGVLVNAINSLEGYKKYRDLEEQGLLLKLPCKVGDTVYVIEVSEEEFEHFHCGLRISKCEFDFWMIPLFGKCVFLTQAEAEEALKRKEK